MNQAQTNTKTQPPTIDQAVNSIMNCLTVDCRREHLAYFRERHGEHFAAKVEASVRERFKGKK